MEKTCSKCLISKSTIEFTKNSKQADKLTVWCKSCSKISRDAYYRKNKESINQKSAVWRNNNKDYIASQKKMKRLEDPRKIMVGSAKHRAKVGGLDFNIDVDDIVIPILCPVFGEVLDVGNTQQKRMSPSLDRIDSTKGYVKGNVQVISWLANTMKTNATQEELAKFANWILGDINV